MAASGSNLVDALTGPLAALDRELSVAATLEQATKALAAHRAWMRRRVQDNKVFPDTLLEGDSPEHGPASWAIGTLPSQAPPPKNAAADLEQGQSSRRTSKNKVAPSCNTSLNTEKGAWLEEGEGPGKSKEHFYSSGKEEGIDSILRKYSTDKHKSKKRGISRSKVQPVGSYDEEDTPHVSVRPTSPEIFIASPGGEEGGRERDSPPSSPLSPPPPSSAKRAWGSQTSLHEDTGQTLELQSGTHNYKDTGSLLHSQISETERDGGEETLNRFLQEGRSNFDGHDHFKPQPKSPTRPEFATRDDTFDTQASTSPHSQLLSSPRSDQSNASYEEEDTLTHIRSLQETSSARVVAVSPAPREQRTSYASQGLSKLSLSEANGRFYNTDYHRGVKEHEGSVTHVLEANWLERGRGRASFDASLSPTHTRFVNVDSLATRELQRSEVNTPGVFTVGEPANNLAPSPTGDLSPVASGKVPGREQGIYEVTEGVSKSDITRTQGKGSVLFVAGGKEQSEELDISQTRGKGGILLVAGGATQSEFISRNRNASPAPPPSTDMNAFPSKDGTRSPPPLYSSSPRVTAAYRSGVKSTLPPTTATTAPLRVEEVSPRTSPTSVSPSLQVEELSTGLSTAVTSAGLVKEAVNGRPDSLGPPGLRLPPLKDVEVTSIYVDGTKLVSSLPPLKLSSPSSSPLLSSHLSRAGGKHTRNPPSYEIHRPQGGGVAPPPPCPLYGTEQPILLESVNVQSPANVHTPVSTSSTTKSDKPHPSTADKPHPLTMVRAKSLGSGEAESSQSRTSASKQEVGVARKEVETPREAASRLNRSSSTLVLNETQQQQSKKRRGSVPAMGTSEAAYGRVLGCEGADMVDGVSFGRREEGGGSARMFSLAGLPQGPGSLHIAAKTGNTRRLLSLLNQGYDIDMPDHEGRTPLMYCIQTQGVHLACADTFIRNGASVNRQTSDGSTALHLAASIGAVSIIELLLLNGAKADQQDFEGRTPLHWATMQKGTKTFTVLLKHSHTGLSSVDDAGMTVLMWAAYNNNPTIVSYLLDRGADTEEKDRDGYTAMHWAVHKDSSHCLQLVLKPDMTYFKDHRGKTVMHMAAEKGSMSGCEVILKLRPDAIHDTDKMDRTPLHYAAACSRVDVSALLLDYGADATHKDSVLKTPLDYAREKRLDYVVALLSCHGNAVADFVRVSRSVGLASVLSRSISFSQLPQSDLTSLDNQPPPSSSGDGRASALSQSSSASLPGGVVSPSVSPGGVSVRGEEASEWEGVDVKVGDYLGRFFPGEQEPIKHYYLRLNTQEGLILWSRSREQSFKNPSKALVLDVHRGPSNTVKSLPSFSPHDLHIYTFWVATSGGVLDLLAYNQDSYEIWITELERLASDNAAKGGPAMVAGGFKGNSVHSSRPSSSMSAVSRASIAPSVGRAFGSDTGMSRHEVMSSRSSIFTVSGEPQGINAESVNQGADSRKDPVSSKRRPFSGKQSRVTPSSSKDLEKSSSVRTAPPLESFIGEGFKSQPSVDEDVDDVII